MNFIRLLVNALLSFKSTKLFKCALLTQPICTIYFNLQKLVTELYYDSGVTTTKLRMKL